MGADAGQFTVCFVGGVLVLIDLRKDTAWDVMDAIRQLIC